MRMNNTWGGAVIQRGDLVEGEEGVGRVWVEEDSLAGKGEMLGLMTTRMKPMASKSFERWPVNISEWYY